ncbi:FadR/GntR family transcriptional regulator [Sphingomonas sp.]|uniref:FadR/GntR family transcriptional regulator n=1 Tax=Sphingomonas sp. TaxID=28214 RepID=UPI0025D94F84|nr:FCD domain-containing protein [Sphingomonas sp.]
MAASGPTANINSAVSQAAQALRIYAMEQDEGEFLGSEDDLIEKLGVSRPTLRQASAQVLQENLISIRRGVGGGYFARRPESASVSRIASIYLQSHGAKLEEIVHAMKPIRLGVARAAARNRDEGLLRELSAFIDREGAETEQGDYASFLRSEREFGGVLGRLGGNSVLNLFLGVIYDFASEVGREPGSAPGNSERIRVYRALRADMARAIIDGDEEIAAIVTGRCSDMVSDWMREDLAGRRFG